MKVLLRRMGVTIWVLLCLLIAFNATIQMFITFAPTHMRNAKLARVELQAIERVRRVWAPGVFATSGLLIVTSVAFGVCAWPRLSSGRQTVSWNESINEPAHVRDRKNQDEPLDEST